MDNNLNMRQLYQFKSVFTALREAVSLMSQVEDLMSGKPQEFKTHREGSLASIQHIEQVVVLNTTTMASAVKAHDAMFALIQGFEMQVQQVHPMLLCSIDELNLGYQLSKCLGANNIFTVGDLVQHTENQLLTTPNLDRKGFNKIKKVLASHGLILGTNIPNWP